MIAEWLGELTDPAIIVGWTIGIYSGIQHWLMKRQIDKIAIMVDNGEILEAILTETQKINEVLPHAIQEDKEET